MSDATTCPQCGYAIPSGDAEPALAGLCPRCLAGGVGKPDMTEPNLRTENARIPIDTIRPPLKPGASFKGFEVLEVLGQGGMGVVYKARQQSLNRLVALKVLNSQLATSEEFAARFDREAKVLASLNHPNVVQVFDFGKEDGLLYLVMEHVDGPTLEDVMKKKPEPGRFLAAIRDVSKGLQRVHEAGLVHRDVKPSNILIAKDGTAKISDFGLAIETEGSQKLTQSGMFVGTPHYVSPEHAQGKKMDGRSDLYSLGVILFEGFAGRPPFQAPSATALLLKHVNEAPPALYKLAPHSPRAVQEIVRKLLAKNPAARHDTASSLVRDLDRAIEEGKAPKVPGTARKAPIVAATPAPSKLPMKWIGAGVAAAAVIAILVAVFSGKSDPPPKEEKATPPVAVSRPALPEPKREPLPEPATPPPVPATPAPAPTPIPAASDPKPQEPKPPSAVEEALRQGDKLFEEARAAYEDGKARSSVEVLTDASFKAEAAKAKYAAVQEIGTDEFKAKAVEQVKLVQQFQKLVNESRLAILEAKGVRPAVPAAVAAPSAPANPEPPPAVPAPRPQPLAPAAAPAVRRAAVPQASVQRDAEKQIRTLFKEDYARKAPADVQALARKLVDLGATVSNDEAARFVMLRDARDFAAQTADLETAMKAVDCLAESFEVEPIPSKIAVVNRIAPLMRGVEGMLSLSKAYLGIMEEGMASGAYDPAVSIAAKAEASAKASNDVILLSRVQTVSRDLAFLQRESSSVRPALKTLEQKPDDPAANLSAGRFTCLGAGDWAKGLPMLAKGGDSLLKAAAEKEMAADDGAAAGDAWWAAAEKERTPEYKRRIQARAARWYLRVVADATGLAKVQMESRLKQVGGLLLSDQPATQRSELVGGPGGAAYDDHSREGGVLIGLRMNWAAGSSALKAVQALFSNGSSLQEGPVRGKPASPFKESLAKPGYAVGGVIARGTNRVNAIKIIYMKISGIALDPRDSYESEWFGDRGPGEVRLAGDGTYVLGICGGAFEEVDSMGLLTLRRSESRGASAPAPAPAARGGIDVLAAIDPKLDFVEGNFTVDGSGLLTPPRVLRARVMVPYTPPAEYDLTMVVERKEGVNSFNYGVHWGGKLISLVVDGKGPAVEDAAGMDFINGRPFFENETLTKGGPFLAQGKPSTIVTSIRKGSVTLTIDGRMLFSWKGDPSRVSENPAIAVPNKGAMSVGCYDSSFLVSQMTVTPMSGPGMFLRKTPAVPAAGAGTPAPKGTLDLLALVDPAKDAVEGGWSMEDKALVSQGGSHVRLMLPYVPPDEYDLRVVMERREGADGVAFGLARGTNQWTVYVDKLPSEGYQSGTELVDNQMITAVRGPQLVTGQPAAFDFKVRRNGFTVLKDGKLLYTWQGNTTRLGNFSRWQVPNPRALFLGQWGSTVRYTEIRVTPVSGDGTLLRGGLPKHAIDLLALIDPSKDAVKGEWTHDSKGLICSVGDHIRLQIPYSPPDEYDLILTVERRDGSDGLLVGLVKGSSQWSVTMDTQSSGSPKSGFELLDNQGPSGNASTYSGPVFTNGVETTLEFRVRKVGVSVLAGGKPIIDWRGNFNRLTLPDGWKVKSPNALFLAAWGSRYHFSRIVLIPVSGQGRKLR